MSGVFPAQNPYKFSTKRQDALTGLYDYGYRSYDPVAGRWLSRDPIAEDGGLNLYGFVGNRPSNDFDVLGLIGGAGIGGPQWSSYRPRPSKRFTSENMMAPSFVLAHPHLLFIPAFRDLYKDYHFNRNELVADQCRVIEKFRGRKNITQAEIDEFQDLPGVTKVAQDKNLFHQSFEDRKCTRGDFTKFRNHKWVFGFTPWPR